MLINALDWCSDVRDELQGSPSIVGPDSFVIFNVLIDPVDRPTRTGRNNAHLECAQGALTKRQNSAFVIEIAYLTIVTACTI